MQDVTPANAGEGYGNVLPYQGTISIAKGTRGTTMQPPILTAFTGLQEIADGGALLYVPIPRNCGIISFRAYMVSVSTPPPIGLEMGVWAEDGYNVIREYDDVACTEGFVPLPPNAIQLVFKNYDGDNATYLALDWGIDG
jgi:hypothetical protein